ncbi:MAG: hypothetical protein JRF61_04995 [Deltaproteobacteria bacterium]|jgi:hypothetical protein|nr:hypothetical protein [Deltaproteobacteria bacterium]
MRRARRILGVSLLLLLLVLGGVAFYLNEIVGRAIEEGGTRALGVRTTVSGVLLRPISGNAHLFCLEIENPPGFDHPYFLTLADGFLSLDAGAIRSDPIEIRQIRLQQVELALERRGGRFNTDAILDHMQGDSATAEAESESSGPKVVVRELLIQDITANVDVAETMGKYGRMEVKIPEIRLEHIAGGGEEGTDLSEVTEVIVSALLGAVARHGVGLPVELTRDLIASLEELGLARFGVVGDATADVVGATGRVLETMTRSLRDAAADAGDEASEVTEGAAAGLKRVGDALGDVVKQEKKKE